MAYRRVQSFEAGSVAQGQEGEAFRTDPLRAVGRNAPRAPGRAEWGGAQQAHCHFSFSYLKTFWYGFVSIELRLPWKPKSQLIELRRWNFRCRLLTGSTVL